jgi:hypothetical protein
MRDVQGGTKPSDYRQNSEFVSKFGADKRPDLQTVTRPGTELTTPAFYTCDLQANSPRLTIFHCYTVAKYPERNTRTLPTPSKLQTRLLCTVERCFPTNETIYLLIINIQQQWIKKCFSSTERDNSTRMSAVSRPAILTKRCFIKSLIKSSQAISRVRCT